MILETICSANFAVPFFLGACVTLSIGLLIYGFCGEANAKLKNECIGYDRKGHDK